jgi:glycosyltransferase involved in cell wall biosynthesis
VTGRVAILSVGRGATGEARRVESWTRVIGSLGLAVEVVPVLSCRPRPADVATMAEVVRGRAVPEALAWSVSAVRARLESIEPDAVVALTLRAFHPALTAGSWRTVLDLVDHLSASYRQRAPVSGRAGGLAYSVLARTAARTETRTRGVPLVAAGRRDAERLGARWLPNVIDVPELRASETAGPDLVFFGALRYAPNVEALHRLAAITRLVRKARPNLTVDVVGRSPGPEVERLARAEGWTVRADVDDMAAWVAPAKLAVAPMVSASGIQNKVLEAAAWGVAQVVSAEAAAGVDPDFPFVVGTGDDDYAAAIVALLDDDRARHDLAARAHAHVAEVYRPDAWAPLAAELLAPGGAPRDR